jgi:hypothetical protein
LFFLSSGACSAAFAWIAGVLQKGHAASARQWQQQQQIRLIQQHAG